MAKSLERIYQFDVLDDGRLLFQSRYYAQRFIDEYLSQWFSSSYFVIDRADDGCFISFKIGLTLDEYSQPVV